MMMCTGYVAMTEDEIAEKLHKVSMALASIYGIPPKFMTDQKKGR